MQIKLGIASLAEVATIAKALQLEEGSESIGIINVSSATTLVHRNRYLYTPNYGNKWLWFVWRNSSFNYRPGGSSSDDIGTEIALINLFKCGISNKNTNVNQYSYLIGSFCIELK